MLLYNKEHSFLYCPIPKVSSSFWMLNMVKLNPELNLDPFWDISKMGPSVAQIKRAHVVAAQKLNLSLAQAKNISLLMSFVVVRHPFERLSSAYFHKIIDLGHKVGCEIGTKFSPKCYKNILIQEWNKQRKAIINKYREQDEKQLESRDKKQTVIQGHEELSAEYPR